MKTLKTIQTLVITATILGSSSLMANGAALFQQCTACHGLNAEKKALGQSKMIHTMSEKELVVALNGYKAGTYGGSMKGFMRGQVQKLSPEDMDALAAHIVTLDM